MPRVAEKNVLLGLSKVLLRMVDREAKRQKVGRSVLIRRALTRYLEQMKIQQEREKGSI